MKTINDYAEVVKATHALNKAIAPVENGATITGSYTSGKQFIRDGVLYTALTTIAASTAWNSLTLDTDYEVADDLSTQIAGIETGLSNEAATRSILGAKNKLPFDLAKIKSKNTAGTWSDNAYTVNGVTFTINTDANGNLVSVVATGTASSDATITMYGKSYTTSDDIVFSTSMIASDDFVGSDSTARAIVWGTQSGYIDGEELTLAAFTFYGFGLRVIGSYEIPAGGITFKPMLRLATDIDGTYQPYADDNQILTAKVIQNANDISSLNSAFTNNVNANGSKNVLWHDLESVYKLWQEEYSNSGSWNGRAWTFVGVTYTFNEDGSISLSGTSTGTPINMRLAYLEGLVDGATYILSNKGSTANQQAVLSIDGTDAAHVYGANTYEFTYDSTKAYKIILKCVVSGTTHNNTVYPMVCLKTDYELDSSYQPPTKTNRQLTEDSVTWDDYSELGAVNYLYPYDTTRSSSSGITFTLNSDNSVSMVSSGAPSSGDGFSYRNNNAAFLRGKTVRFKAEITGNTPTYDKLYFAVICRETESGSNLLRYDLWPYLGDTEVVFTVPSNTNYIIVGCNIQAGSTSAIDCKVSPMVTPVSYNGPYVPRAMTNKELTDAVQYSQKDYTSTDYGIGLSLSKVGRIITAQVIGTLSQATTNNAEVMTLPTEARPSPNGLFFWILDQNALDNNNGVVQDMYKGFINNNGKVNVGVMASGAKTRSQTFSYMAADNTPLT